jgi:hypothetical protein
MTVLADVMDATDDTEQPIEQIQQLSSSSPSVSESLQCTFGHTAVVSSSPILSRLRSAVSTVSLLDSHCSVVAFGKGGGGGGTTPIGGALPVGGGGGCIIGAEDDAAAEDAAACWTSPTGSGPAGKGIAILLPLGAMATWGLA